MENEIIKILLAHPNTGDCNQLRSYFNGLNSHYDPECIHNYPEAVEKVKSGITTIDELLRVAAPPEKYEKPKTRRKNSQ